MKTLERKGWNWAPVPAAILMDPDVTNAAVRVYGYLLWRAGTKGAAWPGVDKICADIPVSERDVHRAFKNLIQTGWIERQRRLGSSSITYVYEEKQEIRTNRPSGHGRPDSQATGGLTDRPRAAQQNESQVNESQINEDFQKAENPPPSFSKPPAFNKTTPSTPPAGNKERGGGEDMPPREVRVRSKKIVPGLETKCPLCGSEVKVDASARCSDCGQAFDIVFVDGKHHKPNVVLKPRSAAAIYLAEATRGFPLVYQWKAFADEGEMLEWEEAEKKIGAMAMKGWVDWAKNKPSPIPRGTVVRSILTAYQRHGVTRSSDPDLRAQTKTESKALHAGDIRSAYETFIKSYAMFESQFHEHPFDWFGRLAREDPELFKKGTGMEPARFLTIIATKSRIQESS